MSRVLVVIPDTDMRARHEGLMAFAKKKGVKSRSLKAGDILVFLNHAKDRLMALGVLDEKDSFGLLGYYRSPHGRVMPEAIQYIPQTFGGGRFDLDEATKLALEELLAKKARQKKEAK